ncbi:MAG TPA: hypothetical protein VMT37_00040 [Solirubrobacterales bacterium]|nr:hypothetical protein [Solirubrobacterales bacterium]
MTLGQDRDRITRVVAAAIGVALVAALLVQARPAGGHGGVLPARLSFFAEPDGAVEVTPAAPRALLESGPLRPGDGATGTLRLRNQTGSRLAVGLRAEPSSTALDGLVEVRLVSGGQVLADTTLQALRRGTPGRLRLAPGAAASVRVIASLPAEVVTGYEGRDVTVNLIPTDGQGR